ncbi:uncharacterized protein METZ01_LOCUS256891, partial [marine metagenome]
SPLLLPNFAKFVSVWQIFSESTILTRHNL